MTKSTGNPGFAPDWCVHFRSMAHHNTCEAGIDYTALNGESEFRRMHRLPCFIRSGDKPGQRVSCEHFKPPNAEEIALHKQWDEDRRKKLKTAMAGITAWRVQHQGRSHAEIVKCPVCQGHLHLSIAAHKGRVRGRCETSECVSWRE